MHLFEWLFAAYNGIATGMAIFLVAAGLTWIFGILKILNMAHGHFFMIGVYVAFGIIGIPLVDARANFIKAVKFGDAVEIATRATKFGRSSFEIEHRLSVGGELHVEGEEKRVWAAKDPDDPDRIKGVRIPADVVAKFG